MGALGARLGCRVLPVASRCALVVTLRPGCVPCAFGAGALRGLGERPTGVCVRGDGARTGPWARWRGAGDPWLEPRPRAAPPATLAGVFPVLVPVPVPLGPRPAARAPSAARGVRPALRALAVIAARASLGALAMMAPALRSRARTPRRPLCAAPRRAAFPPRAPPTTPAAAPGRTPLRRAAPDRPRRAAPSGPPAGAPRAPAARPALRPSEGTPSKAALRSRACAAFTRSAPGIVLCPDEPPPLRRGRSRTGDAARRAASAAASPRLRT